ncbi:MAG: thioesterase family protein [Pseudomonadota bacterium]|nr:thioesterase family protein [Pseudomonadota bacterium]
MADYPDRHHRRRLGDTPRVKSPSPLDPQFIAALRDLFEERIAFNRLIGLRIGEVSAEAVRGDLQMRPELIGHYGHQRLHGGVISAVLDAMAGLAIMAAIGGRHAGETPDQRIQRFAKLGTIDLRVDYLRPATGAHFSASGTVLRLGSRVAMARMEFADAAGQLLATGAAAYIVS